MQPLMLEKIHRSHQGAEASIRRAKDSLFWPGMTAEINQMVTNCSICISMQPKQQKETMMSWEIPTRPWQIVAQDLFKCHNKDYLITVHFYSDYWEIDRLDDTTAKTVIKLSKQQFSRHGIPQKVVTDNGPQFVAEEYEKFTREWGINYVTSSPRYSQSNGKAESAVKIAKNLIKKARKDHQDVHLSILAWRNTPNTNSKSPVQMLMSRRTRTLLPTSDELLLPQVVQGVTSDITARRKQAKHYYDKTAKDLPELKIGETVRVQPDMPNQTWRKATCLQKVGPRSYLIQTEDGQKYRRNRKFLRVSTEEFCLTPPDTAKSEQEPFVQTKTPVSSRTNHSTSKSSSKTTSKSSRRTTSKSSSKTTSKTTEEKQPVKSSGKAAKSPSKTSRTTGKSTLQPSSITSGEPTTASEPACKTRTRTNIQKPAKYKDFVM